MGNVAQVYARSLFEVASERRVLDTVKEQLSQFVDALAADKNLETFFFSPYFSTAEKKTGLSRSVTEAEPTVMSFLEALIERKRMPEISRIRESFDKLWDVEMKVLPVEVTTAVPLDEATVASIGEQHRRWNRQPDQADQRGRPRGPRGHRAPGGQRRSRRVHQKQTQPTP